MDSTIAIGDAANSTTMISPTLADPPTHRPNRATAYAPTIPHTRLTASAAATTSTPGNRATPRTSSG